MVNVGKPTSHRLAYSSSQPYPNAVMPGFRRNPPPTPSPLRLLETQTHNRLVAGAFRSDAQVIDTSVVCVLLGSFGNPLFAMSAYRPARPPSMAHPENARHLWEGCIWAWGRALQNKRAWCCPDGGRALLITSEPIV